MPIHHGGYPEHHPSPEALADRGDGQRKPANWCNGRGEAVERIIADRKRAAAAADDGVRYEEQAYGGSPDEGFGPPTRGEELIFEFPAVSLTFAELQQANRERGKVWGKGQNIPSLFNTVELGGEAGELLEAFIDVANVVASTGKVLNACKKYARHELGIAGGVADLTPVEEELGDVVICCSLLANKLGIDLAKAVANKFNKTSEKHGFPHRLAA